MAGWLSFMGRNVRIVVAVAVIAASVGAAGAIGWLTAPVSSVGDPSRIAMEA